MRKVTPERMKEMETSEIPIIRISLEDLVTAKAVTDPEEVKKITQKYLQKNK